MIEEGKSYERQGDLAADVAKDVENLGPGGQRGYDFAMETMLSTVDCPQCVALKARDMIEQQLKDRKSIQRNRGKLIACKQIMLIPHRCGKGVKGYGFKASWKRDYESEAAF